MTSKRTDIQNVELFHLLVLRVFERYWDRRYYVVKGGVNIRAWFGSLRYSQDMDLDALAAPHQVREGVDKALSSKALGQLLQVEGLSLLGTTRPKQTDTTQRWKFELGVQDSASLRTKIEFSHRERAEEDEIEFGPVRKEVVAGYGILPPTAQHYTAASAVRQKIRALAGRREMQARDIWDLDHLFRTAVPKGPPLGEKTQAVLSDAIGRAVDLSYDAYKGQVVPYLPPEQQDLLGDRDAWEAMQLRVLERLEAL